jgi:phosphopantetheinyl transferase
VPIFFQHQINETTRLGIWKIEETEEFFISNVPLQNEVTHPHKRLQHLAGRFLLQFLLPDFPYELIRIASTRKPFLPNEQYHFSISHCGDYAAAIVSSNQRVGIDIEIPTAKIERIKEKFLNEKEFKIFNIQYSMFNSQLPTPDSKLTTLLWSAKESVFKWYGHGKVDFRQHIQLEQQYEGFETINCYFAKTNQQLIIHYRQFEHLVLAWVMS